MIEILITTTSEYAEKISDQLAELGASAVTWQDAGDQPIYEPGPAEIIEWKEMVISALFDDNEAILIHVNIFLNQLKEQQQLKTYEFRTLVEKDWVRINQELQVPMHFGKRLWICPTNHQLQEINGVKVIFSPGLAFGTGSHPTTALCLEWLDQHIKGGETLIDFGCGSGILGVAALKLGAKKVIGVDHDMQALEATKMNAELNQLTNEQLTTCFPNDMPHESVDILIANILTKPLIELAPHFAEHIKPNGKVVLSGILPSQVSEIIPVYEQWFNISPPVMSGDWVRLEGERNAYSKDSK